MIPVSVMNEHSDAFYHWYVFRERRFIGSENNYLLHIDHHDDMELGAYSSDLSAMPKTAVQALEFTKECLGIADFIFPAIFAGLFSTVHIVKKLFPCSLSSEEMFVRLCGTNRLVCGKYVPFFHSDKRKTNDERYRFYEYKTEGLNQSDILKDTENIVLDIDLDYFCWDDSLKSVPEKRIEITKEAYCDFCENRVHPFRILPRKLISAEEEAGKYYLVYRENYAPEPQVSEETIVRRIDRLVNRLGISGVRPAAIDICRSSYSGYLPAYAAEFTEKKFCERLSELYEIEYIHKDI